MKDNTTPIFQRCPRVLLPLFLASALFLTACSEEPGDWTAMQRRGAYVYGVWNSTSPKKAEPLLHELTEKLADASPPAAAVVETDIPPVDLLPMDGEILDWVQSRPASTYEGKKLYRDRPTSPDRFHTYGFKRQAEAEYQTPRFGSNPLILLEVFDMGTPENAFGIYSFHSYPYAEVEWVGSKAIHAGGYLRFSKGKYFIQIEAYELATGIRDAMRLMAKAVAARIKDPAPDIDILTLLPNRHLRGSAKLFRSDQMLRQIYGNLPTQFPQFQDAGLGVSARYQENPETKNWIDAQIVFILHCPDPDAASAVYNAYREALPTFSTFSFDPSVIFFNELTMPE